MKMDLSDTARVRMKDKCIACLHADALIQIRKSLTYNEDSERIRVCTLGLAQTKLRR